MFLQLEEMQEQTGKHNYDINLMYLTDSCLKCSQYQPPFLQCIPTPELVCCIITDISLYLATTFSRRADIGDRRALTTFKLLNNINIIIATMTIDQL